MSLWILAADMVALVLETEDWIVATVDIVAVVVVPLIYHFVA